MGGIWFGVCWRSDSVWLWRCGVFMQSSGVCWRSDSVWLWRCGVFMQSEALRSYKDDARSNKHRMYLRILRTQKS